MVDQPDILIGAREREVTLAVFGDHLGGRIDLSEFDDRSTAVSTPRAAGES